jgi:DMSO/TMAO reductase YedYZ molybdopterin-dependent catalytic subunit
MVERVQLDPAGLHRRIPLAPGDMTARVTPVGDTIVLCHLGVPRLAAAGWSLVLDGMVARPMTLDLATLGRFPRVEIESVHQCAGNPLAPMAPTQRVCNVAWSGYLLADVLKACGPSPEARYVWSFGADWGDFEGVAIDAYAKDLPIARVGEDVLLAVAMNGEPLRAEQGFPLRLVVPGFYGTNSVKWLTRMTLAATRYDGAFTTRWYNDPVPGAAEGTTRPVWALAPQSVIVSPSPETRVAAGIPLPVWGWAWSDGAVTDVVVESDSGDVSVKAVVEPLRARAWQRFSATWIPSRPGAATLSARAIDRHGEIQPDDAARNAVHKVTIEIV